MKINPHPICFPDYIRIWNIHPAEFRRRLNPWYTRAEQDKLRELLQKFIEETNYPIYLNEY